PLVRVNLMKTGVSAHECNFLFPVTLSFLSPLYAYMTPRSRVSSLKAGNYFILRRYSQYHPGPTRSFPLRPLSNRNANAQSLLEYRWSQLLHLVMPVMPH